MHQTSDPGTDDRRHSADQPEYREAAKWWRILGDRHDDAEAFGDVLDDEADDEKRAERRGADRVGRTNRQAFAKIVQADSDRDDCRERHPRARRTLFGHTLLSPDGVKQEPRADYSDTDDRDALERIAELTSQLDRKSVV